MVTVKGGNTLQGQGQSGRVRMVQEEGKPTQRGQNLAQEDGREKLTCMTDKSRPSPTTEMNIIISLHSEPSMYSSL